MLSKSFTLVLLVCFTLFGGQANGQGEQNRPEGAMASGESTESSRAELSDEQQKQVRAAFDSIKNKIRKGEWKEATKWMTKKAQDEITIEQVISSIGLTKMELPVPIPQFEDAIDEIDNVLIQYGFDKLKIDTSAMFKFKIQMGDEEEDDESDEEAEKSAVDASSREGDKILDHIRTKKNRWEIVGDLWDAKKTSPLSMSPLVGKIEKIEPGEKDVVFLTVTTASGESDGGSGVVIQMVAPPVVLRMVKQDGAWKLDGRDHLRTEKMMKEFLKNRPMARPMENRQDF